MPLPYPWQQLRDLTQVTVVTHPSGAMGLCDHAAQTVSLRGDLTPEERRCTLLHELLHLRNGPQPYGLRAKEEEQVRRSTARVMLANLDALAEALAWAQSPAEAAAELGVDIHVLRKRLRHLNPAERRYLSHRLDDTS